MKQLSSTRPRLDPLLLVSMLVIVTGSLLAGQAATTQLARMPWFWLGACLLAEAGWIRLPDGRTTLSMGSIANFAAVLVLPADAAILCTALASLVMESAYLRKPLHRALYNSAATALTISATSQVLHAFPDTGAALAGTPALLLALAASAATFYACNRGLIIAVVALDQRTSAAHVWNQDFGWRRDALPTAAALSLGVLLAHEYLLLGPLTLLIVLFPGLLVLDTHRHLSAAPEGAPSAETPRPSDGPRHAA